MKRCLQLAALGAGHVAPNPMVGAVLVHNGIIIGEGYHRQFGKGHAEVECLNSVPEASRNLIRESTLYVSLEPCNHYGKTAPCSDLIISNGIPRVVIACTDPFEKVNGSGVLKLKENGVSVEAGILEKEAQYLNRRFFTFHTQKRPYIMLKWAQSSDGKIAGIEGAGTKISNVITDRLVHQWRSTEAAIMVGTRTAIADNPSLTNRLWPGKNPVRVVLDSKLVLPAQYHLLDNSVETVIINQIKSEVNGNMTYEMPMTGETMISATLRILYERNLVSLMVEGGAVLLQSFIDAGLWDEARVITNKSMIIGKGIDAPSFDRAKELKREQVLDDEIVYYIPSVSK